MGAVSRIHWGLVVVAGVLSEVAVLIIFFVLLMVAKLAGVPALASPMSPLDYVDALVSSFVMVFLFALWVGQRIESGFVLHGALIGVVGTLLFSLIWIATTPAWTQPPLYVVAHVLKVMGGIAGGIVVERRRVTA
jgi:hypothetical protein